MFVTPKGDNEDISQEGLQEENSGANILNGSVKIGPLTCVSQEKLYAKYRKDLKTWSKVTDIEERLQAEVVVYK